MVSNTFSEAAPSTPLVIHRKANMKMMARISNPNERGNTAVSDGTNARLIQQEMVERWHPEALYFTMINGRHGAYVVFDLQDAADIPAFCEPLYQGLSAEVEIVPVMTAEDLQKGLGEIDPSRLRATRQFGREGRPRRTTGAFNNDGSPGNGPGPAEFPC
jgi:hypothetical protein